MSSLMPRLSYKLKNYRIGLFVFLAKKCSVRRWSGACAVIIRHALEQRQRSSGQEGCIRLLLLPKAGFNEDMQESFVGLAMYAVYELDRRLLKAVYHAFLPQHVDDNNYINVGQDIEDRKKELRRFWRDVIRDSLTATGIQVVLTGNFSYAAEQEFAGACVESGIRFCALHKETLNTPKLSEFYEDIFCTRKNRFQGTAILAYNEIGRESMVHAGVVDTDRVVVTGMPRLDALHRQARQHRIQIGNRRLVLYFSTDEKTGLPELGRKNDGLRERLKEEWNGLALENVTRDSHLAMLELARENPEMDVYLKTKGNPMAYHYIERVFGRTPCFPANFHLVHGGDPQPLLERSAVVSGMYTTALLEAITLGVPVVMPRFGEAVDVRIAPYYLDLGSSVQYATSKDDLKVRILAASRRTGAGAKGCLDEKTRNLLDKWLGNPDGQSGARVRAVVDAILAAPTFP